MTAGSGDAAVFRALAGHTPSRGSEQDGALTAKPWALGCLAEAFAARGVMAQASGSAPAVDAVGKGIGNTGTGPKRKCQDHRLGRRARRYCGFFLVSFL